MLTGTVKLYQHKKPIARVVDNVMLFIEAAGNEFFGKSIINNKPIFGSGRSVEKVKAEIKRVARDTEQVRIKEFKEVHV